MRICTLLLWCLTFRSRCPHPCPRKDFEAAPSAIAHRQRNRAQSIRSALSYSSEGTSRVRRLARSFQTTMLPRFALRAPSGPDYR